MNSECNSLLERVGDVIANKRPCISNSMYSRVSRALLHVIVKFFVSLFSNGPEQGSVLWKLRRHKTIGGSEIHNIALSKTDDILKSPNVIRMIMQKIGMKSFYGSTATRWGNLMEEVTTMFYNYTYNTKVMGDQIFVYGVTTGQSYSPDGISVVDIDSTIKVFDGEGSYHEVNETVPKITLAEFKSPWTRIPNGKIPANYNCQVKAGLDTIRMCDIGIYFEAVIRTCSIDQWKDNHQINQQVHTKDGDRWEGNGPLSLGFIVFHAPSDSFIHQMGVFGNKFITNETYHELDSVADLGAVSASDFSTLMCLWKDSKKISASYSNLVIHDGKEFKSQEPKETYKSSIPANDNYNYENIHLDREHLEALFNDYIQSLPAEEHILGILPWKIMHTNGVMVEKEEDYVKKHHADILRVTEVVNKCNSTDTISEKITIYNQCLGNDNDSDGYED